MKRRFLHPERPCPKVYAVDSTDPSVWEEKCRKPAFKLVEDFIEGKESFDLEPLPLIEVEYEPEDLQRVFTCDTCNKTMKGRNQYEAHLASKRHKAAKAGVAKRKAWEEKVKGQPEEMKKEMELVFDGEVEATPSLMKLLKDALKVPLIEVREKIGNGEPFSLESVGENDVSDLKRKLSEVCPGKFKI